MIRSLHIRNLALIDRMDIDFVPGLNVITGETGAGKSIMIGGLSLILGKRADTSLMRDKARKLIVEGSFDLATYGLEDFFRQNDLDYEPESLLRREISPSGKSRAFVNDTPVLLDTLEKLGKRLVDIHSQNQNALLRTAAFRLGLLDAVAGNGELLQTYRRHYGEFLAKQKEWQEWQAKFDEFRASADYRQFQLEELNRLDWDLDLEQAEQQLRAYENREKLLETLSAIQNLMDDETAGIMDRWAQARRMLDEVSGRDEELQSIGEQWDRGMEQLNDSLLQLAGIAERYQWMDDQEAQHLREQIDAYFRLMTKHRVQTQDELAALKEQLEKETGEWAEAETRLARLEAETRQAEKQMTDTARELFRRRSRAVSQVVEYTQQTLAELGMEHSRLKIELAFTGKPDEWGMTRAEFLLSADKGLHYGDINKVASGGEMSRLMLAFKSLIARHQSWPTVVFDEIDAGVSGEVARKMARLIREMSQRMQIILITHLPQMAIAADKHFKVAKTEAGDHILSQIRELDREGRIREIAEMIEGKPPSESALRHAEFLLEQARKSPTG